MAVDVQVANGLDVQVNQSVAGDLVQHVVKKTDASAQIRQASAVQVHAGGDLSFGSVASDFGCSLYRWGGHGHFLGGKFKQKR
jgi:hypothetical protein